VTDAIGAMTALAAELEAGAAASQFRFGAAAPIGLDLEHALGQRTGALRPEPAIDDQDAHEAAGSARKSVA
jgi:uncharacterized membrane-anchored protein